MNAGLTSGCGTVAFCNCNVFGTPNYVGCAPSCICDTIIGQAHDTEGYDITFNDLVAFLLDDCSVIDAYGNTTMCFTFENTCEVNAFLSQHLIAYGGGPLSQTVAVQVCVNDSRLEHPNPNPLNAGTIHKWSECQECEPVTVQVTFNKQCMLNAISTWIATWQQQYPNWSYRHWTAQQWFIHVGAIKCDGC
ncbi:MAG: hypothetical protein AB7O52_06330 [Planctomycetota bacterium]